METTTIIIIVLCLGYLYLLIEKMSYFTFSFKEVAGRFRYHYEKNMDSFLNKCWEKRALESIHRATQEEMFSKDFMFFFRNVPLTNSVDMALAKKIKSIKIVTHHGIYLAFSCLSEINANDKRSKSATALRKKLETRFSIIETLDVLWNLQNYRHDSSLGEFFDQAAQRVIDAMPEEDLPTARGYAGIFIPYLEKRVAKDRAA